ncbi:MAG: hypothetical protein QNJ46_09685 [Leptolyngbyaceae cyanobacterium MO_188.B28]|nr:hypothetical protein [Leptolyngbyaceae cyanobacterium MO_188.B28]
MATKLTWVALGVGALVVMATVYAKQTVNMHSGAAITLLEETLPTQNGVGVVFEGAVPAWAEDAIAVMAKLEQWRGKAFTQNLQVTFQLQGDEGVAGWYNSQTKQLMVSTAGSERFGQGVMLHEIFHALQDQSFDLFALHSRTMPPDQEKALTALIEGEAMLAVSELMDYDFEAHAQLPVEGPVSDELFEKLFIYAAGVRFVRTLREAGGWDAVDAAFADPPSATTLIFQPERYLAGEREVAISDIPIAAGEQMQSTEVQGEYGVRLWLVRDPKTRPLVELAGDAYEADVLAVLTNADGQAIQRWVIEFSDPEIAHDMGDAAVDLLPQKADTFMVEVSGKTVTLEW